MNRTASRTGLFLMELILAVLFFSLAGAVCIQLFVNSHLISQKSVELNHGVLWCQNVAESFYACDGELVQMAALLSEGALQTNENGDEVFTICFDEDFTPVPDTKGTCSYQLTTTVSASQEHLLTCQITLLKTADNTTVYELSPTLFIAKEAAHD